MQSCCTATFGTAIASSTWSPATPGSLSPRRPHQGRESFGDPVGYYDANLSGTVNLLRGLTEATRRSGEPARLALASTVMVNGPSNGQPIYEQHQAAPISPYGASKLACEQLLSYQAATGELGAISLQVFAAAGAVGRHGDRDLGRLIPKALAVARGQVPYMEVNGDGSAVREFIHVADVAEAYLLALDAVKPGEHEVYNIGTGSFGRPPPTWSHSLQSQLRSATHASNGS
jgi:UDP-glucose 4-epimerase